MSKVKAFFKRKDIEVSLKRYGIDALGAMAQGLFCTLLVGTILDTLGVDLARDIAQEQDAMVCAFGSLYICGQIRSCFGLR